MRFGQHTGHSSSWNCLICFHKTFTQHLTTGLQQCSCPRTHKEFQTVSEKRIGRMEGTSVTANKLPCSLHIVSSHHRIGIGGTTAEMAKGILIIHVGLAWVNLAVKSGWDYLNMWKQYYIYCCETAVNYPAASFVSAAGVSGPLGKMFCLFSRTFTIM